MSDQPLRPIYLDHHATTPVDARVLAAMQPWFAERFGNPASVQHVWGLEADLAVRTARAQLAALLATGPEWVVWTGGATEACNLAIAGTALALADRGRHIVTATTEHPAVLDPCARLEARGWTVTRLPVAGDGSLYPADVATAIRDDTVLVSLMAANNEIGVLHDLPAIGAICRERGVRFHTDATQAVGKVPLDATGVDLLSLSAHKLYGPKGVGALLVRPGISLEPLMAGGGHERGLRPGTANVPGIVGLGVACELAATEIDTEAARLAALRDRLLTALRDRVPDMHVNGPTDMTRRLPGNLNVSIDFVDGEQLVTRVCREVAVSSGSACTSARAETSHVLLGLGHSRKRAEASLRFGLGRTTTAADVDRTVDVVARVVSELRAIDPLWELHRNGVPTDGLLPDDG